MKQVKKVITAIKGFFVNIANFAYSFWCGCRPLARVAVASGLVAVIVLAITLPILLGRNSKDEDVARIEPATVTPVLTKLPTPPPTAVPTATATPTVTSMPTPEPTPTPDLHPGELRSRLTGEWLPREAANKRPFAVMLNNLSIAAPQSGIGEASILYEALTEAGITRFMAIFENITENSSHAKRIGSVRSARHYYVSFANDYDAILVNYGRTTYAEKKIKKLGIDHLDGLDGVGYLVYYRDNEIKAPHNAFASLEGIQAGIENLKIRTEYREDLTEHFTFAEKDFVPAGEKLNKLTLGFSSYISPYFLYDRGKGEYVRYQFDEPHTDYNTGEQLKFKNIIIQLVDEWNKDKNGYQTMDINETEGKGYYISNGHVVDITWKRVEKQNFMQFYDMEGNVLEINVGKTYIGVYPLFQMENLLFNDASVMAEPETLSEGEGD